jgi:hypothetical protein
MPPSLALSFLKTLSNAQYVETRDQGYPKSMPVHLVKTLEIKDKERSYKATGGHDPSLAAAKVESFMKDKSCLPNMRA